MNIQLIELLVEVAENEPLDVRVRGFRKADLLQSQQKVQICLFFPEFFRRVSFAPLGRSRRGGRSTGLR